MNWSTGNSWTSPWPTITKNEWDDLGRDELLIKHQELKTELEQLKQKELDLRKYIVKRAFPNATEGTNTLELGSGYELKIGVKFNYKLDPDLDKVENTLKRIAAMGNEGSFVADRLVGWTANFHLTEYRKLQADDATDIQKAMKKEIDAVLVITDAAPTLDIKAPKAKK